MFFCICLFCERIFMECFIECFLFFFFRSHLKTTYTDKGPKVSKSFFRLNLENSIDMLDARLNSIVFVFVFFKFLLFFLFCCVHSFPFDWNTLASWWKVHCIWSHYILCGQCKASSQLLYNPIGIWAVGISRIRDGQSTICQARGETE